MLDEIGVKLNILYNTVYDIMFGSEFVDVDKLLRDCKKTHPLNLRGPDHKIEGIVESQDVHDRTEYTVLDHRFNVALFYKGGLFYSIGAAQRKNYDHYELYFNVYQVKFLDLWSLFSQNVENAYVHYAKPLPQNNILCYGTEVPSFLYDIFYCPEGLTYDAKLTRDSLYIHAQKDNKTVINLKVNCDQDRNDLGPTSNAKLYGKTKTENVVYAGKCVSAGHMREDCVVEEVFIDVDSLGITNLGNITKSDFFSFTVSSPAISSEEGLFDCAGKTINSHQEAEL